MRLSKINENTNLLFPRKYVLGPVALFYLLFLCLANLGLKCCETLKKPNEQEVHVTGGVGSSVYLRGRYEKEKSQSL